MEHSEPSQNFSSTYILSFVRILNFCDLYQKLITYCIFEKMILLNNIKPFSCLIMRKNYNGRLSPKLDEVRNKRYMIIAPNKISISSILFFQPPITWVLSKIFSAAVQYSYVLLLVKESNIQRTTTTRRNVDLRGRYYIDHNRERSGRTS